MFIDLKQLKLEPLKVVRYEFNEIVDDPKWHLPECNQDVKEVFISMEAYYCDSIIFFEGEMKTLTGKECDRCLTFFEKTISVKFRDEIRLALTDNGEDILEDNDIKEIFSEDRFLLAGDSLNMSEYFRQNYIVSLDMKSLCSIKCLGLCPICGKNRNFVKCDCKEEIVDSRLEKLKEIKKQLSESDRRK